MPRKGQQRVGPPSKSANVQSRSAPEAVIKYAREGTGPIATESVVHEWKKLALSSSYFFGKVVCGFTDMTADLHQALCAWMERPSARKLGLAPRDHMKTTTWTICHNLWLATRDPNTRILIINETQANAMNFLHAIKSIVENREIYHLLFPEVVPDFGKRRWASDKIELNRTADWPEATIEVIGVGGASTSRHYNRVHEDDLIGKEAAKSRAAMQEAIDQHKLAESLLIRPTDTIACIGTRWGPHDLIDWMLRNEPDLDYFCLSYTLPDGSPIWPERFSLPYFEMLKKKYGPAFFALQYENRVTGAGVTDLNREWLRLYHLDDHPVRGRTIVLEDAGAPGGERRYPLSACSLFQIVDPGLKKESTDARTAVIVAAITPTQPFDIVLLQARAEAVDPGAVVSMAAEEWEAWQPAIVGIEVVAGQAFLFEWIAENFPEMPAFPLKTDTTSSKDARILSIAPYARQGRVWIRRDHANFVEEWETFPAGRTKDLIDAFSYLPQIWFPPEGRAGQTKTLYDEWGDPIREIEWRDSFDARRTANPITGY